MAFQSPFVNNSGINPYQNNGMAISGPPSGNSQPYYGGGFGGGPAPLQSPNSTYGLNPAFNDRVFGYRVQENQNQSTSSQPTNVLNVLPQLSQAISGYQNWANNILGQSPQLNNNFVGAKDYQNQLSNGIDYFGRLGISEGLQNINLQRDAANQQLQNTLGRDSGNNSLIQVLQNQNAFRSQLAGQPLISEAQKGTAQRVSDMVNLQNSIINAQNQNNLSGYQAQLAGGQPYQNLLAMLGNLQQQGAGNVTNNIGFGSSTK